MADGTADVRGKGSVVASLQPWVGPNRKNPWRARVRVDYTEHFLGVFPTRAEAEEAEAEFRRLIGRPPKTSRLTPTA